MNDWYIYYSSSAVIFYTLSKHLETFAIRTSLTLQAANILVEVNETTFGFRL